MFFFKTCEQENMFFFKTCEQHVSRVVDLFMDTRT